MGIVQILHTVCESSVFSFGPFWPSHCPENVSIQIHTRYSLDSWFYQIIIMWITKRKNRSRNCPKPQQIPAPRPIRIIVLLLHFGRCMTLLHLLSVLFPIDLVIFEALLFPFIAQPNQTLAIPFAYSFHFRASVRNHRIGFLVGHEHRMLIVFGRTTGGAVFDQQIAFRLHFGRQRDAVHGHETRWAIFGCVESFQNEVHFALGFNLLWTMFDDVEKGDGTFIIDKTLGS